MVEWYKREELPQIGQTDLQFYDYSYKIVRLDIIIPVQKERIEFNRLKQLTKIRSGRYVPIVVDKDLRIINGHHRYDVLNELGYENAKVAIINESLEKIIEKSTSKKNILVR